MSPERRARIEASRPMFVKRAKEQYGVEIHSGPFDVDSRPALIAEKFAESKGKGEAFHEAMMKAYWQQAKRIDDEQVLKEIAASVGVNTDNFSSVLKDPKYDEEVSADVALAEEYQLSGVPALVFANRYLVMGAQPYEVLQQVVERVQSEDV